MTQKHVKHFRLTERDNQNLKMVKRKFDCISENDTIRTSLRIAADVAKK